MRPCWLLLLVGCVPAEGPESSTAEAAIDRWHARHDIARSALLANRCGEPWLRIRRDVGPDERFAVASASKWVAAGVFLALHDRGRVDLDTPISTWLPELTGPRRDATLRQIAGNRGGFLAHHPCVGEPDLTLRQCALEVTRARGDRPGTTLRYSNTGWSVGAAATEAATGHPFHVLLDQTLGQPLGWTDVGYGEERIGPNPAIAGDLRIGPDQYLDWLQLVLDGGLHDGVQVLQPASVEAMWSGPALPRRGFVPPPLRPRLDRIYGLGAWLDEVDPDGEVRVATANGRFGFQVWIDRQRQVAAVLAVELHGEALRGHRPRGATVRGLVAELADAEAPCDQVQER